MLEKIKENMKALAKMGKVFDCTFDSENETVNLLNAEISKLWDSLSLEEEKDLMEFEEGLIEESYFKVVDGLGFRTITTREEAEKAYNIMVAHYDKASFDKAFKAELEAILSWNQDGRFEDLNYFGKVEVALLRTDAAVKPSLSAKEKAEMDAEERELERKDYMAEISLARL